MSESVRFAAGWSEKVRIRIGAGESYPNFSFDTAAAATDANAHSVIKR